MVMVTWVAVSLPAAAHPSPPIQYQALLHPHILFSVLCSSFQGTAFAVGIKLGSPDIWAVQPQLGLDPAWQVFVHPSLGFWQPLLSDRSRLYLPLFSSAHFSLQMTTFFIPAVRRELYNYLPMYPFSFPVRDKLVSLSFFKSSTEAIISTGKKIWIWIPFIFVNENLLWWSNGIWRCMQMWTNAFCIHMHTYIHT